MNQRKAGTILSYIYIFLSNTISIFYTPIYLSMLGQSEYGLIGTAGSLTAYLSLLSMGVGGAYIKFNATARATGSKEEEYKVNGMFQTIYFFISIATLIVGTVLLFSSSYIFSANYN
jgi:O-antigen/teichoic acid export membrane protein